ncbi:MAG: hypothetical protein U0797_25345 [Gemmataceae bacterium]
MAKKKDGSGSNLGLIITLVFFVLSTVILGVTTYMGFSAQDEKDKAVTKMQQEKNQADKDAKWGRFKANVERAMLDSSQSPGIESAEVARELQQFLGGSYDAANNQKDKDDFAAFLKKVPAQWDPSRSSTPAKSIEQLLREKDQQIQAERARAKNAQDAADREKRQREEADAEANKAIASLKSAMEAAKTKAVEDRKADLGAITSQRDSLKAEDETHQSLRKRFEDTEKARAKYEAQLKRVTTELADAKRNLRTVSEERDAKDVQLTRALDELGKPISKIEEAVKDARFAQMLREWKKDWRVMDLYGKGGMVYINLGTSDNLQPQVTFSIHGAGLDGQLNPNSKGTIEVVRVLGSHLSLARVTSEKDPKNFKKDPIVRGDRLFNPTWDPTRKRHVAIAGVADLGGEGTDNTEDLRRMLQRQNVEIDAYIDVKSDKEPRLEGPGITSNTDFLILADNLESIHHPQARSNKDYVSKFHKIEKDMKAKALENGVQIISLRRYLDMIGYQPPRVVKPLVSGTGR